MVLSKKPMCFHHYIITRWIKKPNESLTIFLKIVTLLDKKSKECIPKFLITYGKQKIPHDSTKYIGGTIFVFSDKSMANVTDATALR